MAALQKNGKITHALTMPLWAPMIHAAQRANRTKAAKVQSNAAEILCINMDISDVKVVSPSEPCPAN